MVQGEIFRKGPWTEQEDFKLVYFVSTFGDRRWDFIAKVSGLNRTGKSCRLRWVNYLHPDLKRGKLTPQEERLVIELHSKWGNRWSRIARKLPGRTDNEIKNFWRTHMRKKKAQDKKRASSSSSPSSSSSCQSSLTSINHVADSKKDGEESFYDTGGHDDMIGLNNFGEEQLDAGENEKGCYYSMDDILQEIAMLEDNIIDLPDPPMLSPSWDYNASDQLWVMDEEENNNMTFPITSHDQYFSYELDNEFLKPVCY